MAVRPVPLPPARWPDRETAEGSRLFSPVRLGPLEARQRTWVPAMVPWRATADGFVTRANLDWYARFAAGRPGVLVAEATGIRDVPSGPLLRIGHDRFVPGLRDLVAAVQDASDGETRLLIQILDFLGIRRRPEPGKFFARFLEVTDGLRERIAARTGGRVPVGAPEAQHRAWCSAASDADLEATLDPRDLESLRYGYRERVTDLHLPHVRELPQVLPDLFADAAGRAREAGFDGVELHFAHAYTMASFLSRTNDRDDGYGGSREERVRLALEVLEAVRGRVGDAFCVGARILGDEVIPGGSRVADAAYYAVELAACGLDFLSVSKGGRFEDAAPPRIGEAVYPYTGTSGHECMPTVRIDARGPFGRNVPLAATIRRAVRDAGHTMPIVAAGGLCTFEQAEAILRLGQADVIASARQSLADPDWWRKMYLGQGNQIRRCVFTNYCEGLDRMHKEVTCKLWDKAFDAPDAPVAPVAPDAPVAPVAPIARSADGRRRLVPPTWP